MGWLQTHKGLVAVAIAAVVAAVAVPATVVVATDDSPPKQTAAPRTLGEIQVNLTRKTPTRITFGWTPVAGYGYLFSADNVVRGRTYDPDRNWATFRNIYSTYEVAAISKGATGTYPPLAGTLSMSVLAETANTITFGWTPQAGYGYLFSGDGNVVSRTYSQSRSYVKFSKSYTNYEVAVLTKGDSGTYPPSEPPPDGGSANLWIDQNGGNCVRSATAIVYSGSGDSNSCGSLNAAYAEANVGDYINIVAGTYDGSMTIDAASKSCTGGTNRVTFRVATGATVTFSSNQLIIQSNCITIDGSAGTLNSNVSFKVEGGANYVTLAHIDARGEQSQVYYSSNVTITDVDMGGFCYAGAPGADALNVDAATNLIIQDSNVGDICYFPPEHPDCAAIISVQNMIFRRNKVFWCGTQGFYTESDFGGAIDHVLVENNWFSDLTRPGQSDAYYIAQIHYGSNLIIRYNSFGTGVDGTLNIESHVAGPVAVDGNAGQLQGCPSGTFSYNVWTDAQCSATDITADPNFVQSTGGYDMNLHLANSSSPACSRGRPGVAATGGDFATGWWANLGDFPATDIDGQARSSPPDAGADERSDC